LIESLQEAYVQDSQQLLDLVLARAKEAKQTESLKAAIDVCQRKQK
jgi:hypothetical protein